MEITLKELCNKLGVASNVISVYVKRGKLIKLPNGKFDTEDEINSLFFEKRGVSFKYERDSFDNSADFIRQSNDAERLRLSKSTSSFHTEQFNRQMSNAGNGESIVNIEKAIKVFQANKLKRENAILDIKIDKLKASVIPTDLVKLVVSQQFKSAASAFRNGADKFISVIAKENELSHERKNRLRAELVDIINMAIGESIEESKKQINAIVSEFKESRGVGERK